METKSLEHIEDISEHQVVHMLELAERLRMSMGSELDDEAIAAVAELSHLPVEHVRAIVGRMPEGKTKRGLLSSIRHAILGLDPDTRRYVGSGILATNFGLLNVVGSKFGDQFGLMGVAAGAILIAALWNFAVSRETKTALIAGALFGGVFFVTRSLFLLAFRGTETVSSGLILPFIIGFGLGALAIQTIASRLKKEIGGRDSQTERQDLLRQLVDLQDRLRSGEQSISFLSLDVVGSTQLKQNADSLSVEYTFTEYHNWVSWIVTKYGGKVHSTAGDGVTCAFEHPQQAYSAARYMQSGIVELNAFKNKIGSPIVLRAGIHYGVVNAPAGEDITKLNFASVIDIAAHMQKVAPPGGIAISEAAAQYVPGGAMAIGREQVEISDTKGWVWQPKALTLGGGSGPPALPEGA